MVEEKKNHKSFHDISPRDYMYFPKATLEMGKIGQFSLLEISHILFSILVLTISFTFALSMNSIIVLLLKFNTFSIERLSVGFILSLVAMISAFFFHELSHKLMAQHFHLWSEFRMYPKGLIASLLLSIGTGFTCAAPGAVMFRGEPRTFEEGKIAMSGPLANIIIAGIFLPLFLLIFYRTQGIVMNIIGFICLVNSVFAIFNLLPFGPLDGVKIFEWSPAIWSTMFIISGSILVILFPFIQTFILYI